MRIFGLRYFDIALIFKFMLSHKLAVWKKSTVRVLSIFLLTGLLAGCGGEEPILLSLEEFRQPVDIEGPRNISVNGKIVIYDNYLLVNEPLKGVHIFDNSEPELPIPMGFLPIFLNTDIFVKNDLLYANSSMDLVVLSISDISNVSEIFRKTDVLPPYYEPSEYGVDPDSDVIIGLEWVSAF